MRRRRERDLEVNLLTLKYWIKVKRDKAVLRKANLEARSGARWWSHGHERNQPRRSGGREARKKRSWRMQKHWKASEDNEKLDCYLLFEGEPGSPIIVPGSSKTQNLFLEMRLSLPSSPRLLHCTITNGMCTMMVEGPQCERKRKDAVFVSRCTPRRPRPNAAILLHQQKGSAWSSLFQFSMAICIIYRHDERPGSGPVNRDCFFWKDSRFQAVQRGYAQKRILWMLLPNSDP